MRRRRLTPRRSKKLFRKTAMKVNRKNVVTAARGGIRM